MHSSLVKDIEVEKILSDEIEKNLTAAIEKFFARS
jgi:hypothetical protein